MADFFRPEVKALAWRYRDALAGASIAAIGLYLVLTRVGLIGWLGWLMLAGGAIWTVAGIQRGRFRQDTDGPGVVQIRERRLAYFGPLDGGVMDIADLTQLEFDPTSHPSPSWVLSTTDGRSIAIPIDAKQSEALFDVFASLPDINTTTLLSVLSRTPDARTVIWQRHRPLLH